MSVYATSDSIKLTHHAVGPKNKARLSSDRTPLLEMQRQWGQDTFESQASATSALDLLAPLLQHAATTPGSETSVGKPMGLKKTTSIPSRLDLLVQAAEETEGTLAEDWVQVDLDKDVGSKPRDFRPGSKVQIGRFEITDLEEDDSLLESELVELGAMRPSTPSPTLFAPTPRKQDTPAWILGDLDELALPEPPSFPLRAHSADVFAQQAREQTTDFELSKEWELFCSELPSKPPFQQSTTQPISRPIPTVALHKEPLSSSGLAISGSATGVKPLIDLETHSEAVPSEPMPTPGIGHFPLRRTASANAILDLERIAPPTQDELLENLNIPYQFKLLTPKGAQPRVPVSQAAKQLKVANTVVLGDLHGSYRKLVETLVAADMLTMPGDVAQQFAAFARDPVNFSQDPVKLSEHADSVMKLVPFMSWKGGDRKLVLVGDVLGDRGPFDQVTLAIVQKMTQKNPQGMVRIASNHDHNVLRYMIYGLNGIDASCTNSLQQSFKIATQQRKVDALHKGYFDYLAESRLMHYEPASKTLYTHAPITKAHVKQLIELMKAKREAFRLGDVPEYEAIRTPDDMNRFVEQTNRFYREYVLNAAETKKLDLDVEKVLVGDLEANGFLWSRTSLAKEDELPFREQGVVSRLAHGHDQLSDASPFSIDQASKEAAYQVVNLDQDTRKYDVVESWEVEARGAYFREHGDKLRLDSRLYIE